MVAAAGLCSGPQTGHGSAFWVPKAVAQTPQGGAAPASQTTTEQMGAAKGKGRVLYYRNPTGLPDRSEVPKKDPMGMEYIPVYENEADDKTKARVSSSSPESTGGMASSDPPVPGTGAPASEPNLAPVTLSPQRMQSIGVKTGVVEFRPVRDEIRTVGNVEVDETRLSDVQIRFAGWVQKVYADATYKQVRQGQPLLTIYSPELVVLIGTQTWNTAARTPPIRNRLSGF